jgi:riboflavin kinase/FMN adenylyltransferase
MSASSPRPTSSPFVVDMFDLAGVVEHGDKRGRELGFPTANLSPDFEGAVPPEGVYAGWFRRPNGSVMPAAVSIGRRPTFYRAEADSLLIEAYLIDFTADLYDEHVTLRLVQRLRGQVRFEDVRQLVAQMHKDVAQCRVVLASPDALAICL